MQIEIVVNDCRVEIYNSGSNTVIAMLRSGYGCEEITSLPNIKGIVENNHVRVVGFEVVEYLDLDKSKMRQICASIRLVASQI